MKAASVIVPTAQPATPRQRRHWLWRRIILGILGGIPVVLGVASYLFLHHELPSSALQARYLSALVHNQATFLGITRCSADLQP